MKNSFTGPVLPIACPKCTQEFIPGVKWHEDGCDGIETCEQLSYNKEIKEHLHAKCEKCDYDWICFIYPD